MSDEKSPEEEVRRPNANYKLSEKHQEEEGKLTFYYSREKRLEKAPQAVRDLYNQKKPRFSLIGPLVATKGKAILFITMLLICVTLLLISVLDTDEAYNLEGNRITVQAVKHEGAIIVLIKKSLAKKRFGKPIAASAYTGTVDIGASPQQAAPNGENSESPRIFMHRIFFTTQDTEEFRFTLPFDSDSVIMVLQTEKNQISIKVDVE
jgi:hypothetical protein